MVKTVTSPKLVALLDEDPLWEREQKPEKVVSVKKTSKKDKKK